MSCDAILQQGVFDTIIVNSNRSVSDNLISWLSTASYADLKQKLDGGMKLAFPIKGVPIEIKGNYSSNDFDKWKQEYAARNTRSFSEQETLQIISSSVSKTIADAWLECYIRTKGLGSSGLVSSIEAAGNQDTAVFTARYLPTSMDDYPPTVTSFQIAGASTDYPLVLGQEVPLGGVSVLVKRQGDSVITVVLNTTKGTVTEHSRLPDIGSDQMALAVDYENYVNPQGGQAGERFALYIAGPTRGLDQIQEVKYLLNHSHFGFTGQGLHMHFTSVPHTKEVVSVDAANRFKSTIIEAVVYQIIACVKLRNGATWQYAWQHPTRKPLFN